MKRVSGLAFLTAILMFAAIPGAGALDADGVVPSPVGSGHDGVIEVGAAADYQATANASTGDGATPVVGLSTLNRDGPSAQGSAATPGTAREVAGVAVGAAVGLAIVVLFWNSIKGWLLGTLLVPLFSRIDSNRILDNDVRNKVHEAILQNPGITIKEITKVLGIGWGTAIYHLKRLETERLIVSERHRQFRRFFKNGGGIVNEAKTAYSELKNPTTHRLAAALLEHPGAAQKELCEALGISAPLAHKYLSRMEDARLLTRQREWKFVKYFPTAGLAELVQATTAPILVAA